MYRKFKLTNLKKYSSNISDKANKAKRIGISICLCLCTIFRLCVPVSAETSEFATYYEIGHGNSTYGFEDLLSRYRNNCITYKINILDYQIQALNSNIADENYSLVNSQHLELLERIGELEQTKEALIMYKNNLLSQTAQVVSGSAITAGNTTSDDIQELINEIDIQIANIDSQLLQYKSSRSSVEKNLSEAKLSKNISSFYSSHQSMIEDEAKKRMENAFLKQCYNLIIYQEQLDYYKVYSEYLTMLREVDSIRYRYGLVTEIELYTDEVNILNNERAITDKENNYEAIIKAIKKDTGIKDELQIRLPLSNIKKNYNLETMIQEYINKHSGYQQIQNYINSYENHLYKGKSGSYSSYRQTEARIEYYKLQKEELENSIRTYVSQAIYSYEQAIRSRDASLKELQIKSDLYNAYVNKLNYKRASQLELAKSLYEKEAAELAYYQCCYDIVVWQNILDNYIYGAMP